MQGSHIPKFSIALAGSPNSCLVKIQHKKYRSLVDSGAEVSLMHRRVYTSIENAPKLTRKKAILQSGSGNSLSVDGCVNIPFVIGGIQTNHLFYVVSDMNRNLILGRDWLTQNGVRLYYDLGCLRIGKSYVPLVEDIHIASIVRMMRTLTVPPQTATVCSCVVRSSPDLPSNNWYKISAIDHGFVSTEPGLMISNSVAKINDSRKIPIMLVNSTNKT